MAQAARAETRDTEKPAQEPMKYAVIKLHAARSEHEILRPSVNINGKIYQLPRQVPLPVPSSVVEALNHTEHPVYKTEHGNNRSVAHMTARYPFDTIYREISEATYRKLVSLSKERNLSIDEVDAVVKAAKTE